jgi:hypothetical protein
MTVKIFISTDNKNKEHALALSRALHNKHGCEVLFTVPSLDAYNFPKSNIQVVPYNNFRDIEQALIINKFTVGIVFNDIEINDKHIFSIKAKYSKNDEYVFESKKDLVKSMIKNDNFVENDLKDIPILTLIYKNSSPSILYTIDNNNLIVLRGIETESRVPSFPYKLKDYENNMITIKPLCNWESPLELFNDFKRFSKDNNGKWNNFVLDPTTNSPDYYLVLNSTSERFDPSKTIWFCMEPKMETHPGWSQFCTMMNNANPLYNGSHSLQMNNVEWHLSKTYKELCEEETARPSKFYDKVLSVVVSDRCVDEGHKLRLDFIKDLDKRKDLGFDLHIYGKCKSLNFKNYKGELPRATKDDGIFPYKYHFNAENHSYDNYITEKFTDGIIGETLFFYWGCTNTEKYYDKNCFIKLSLKPEDRETDISMVKEAIINDEWSKRIETIRKEKKKMYKVYNMYPRIESILFLNKTTIILENSPDTQTRGQYLLKQNFKNIRLADIVMGQQVFMEMFNLAVTSKSNMMLILKTTNIIDLHHKLCVCISESRELEDKIPEMILIDDNSFFITPEGGAKMLEIIKTTMGGISFENLYNKLFYKKL